MPKLDQILNTEYTLFYKKQLYKNSEAEIR